MRGWEKGREWEKKGRMWNEREREQEKGRK